MNTIADPVNHKNAEQAQQPVIDFLSSVEAYPVTNDTSGDRTTGSQGQIRIISTHCAHVFLADQDVYKIKRAVSYSYLDMSTLEARRVMCERELELNRPVLPDIYKDVVPITQQDDGSIAINGSGRTVEWAVHMQRFNEELVLDSLATEHSLDDGLAARMGRSIADYHAALPVEAVRDGHARIEEVVHELIYELDRFESVFSRSALDEFKRSGMQELADCKLLLDQRALDGFIRRCHGDLHLRNILLHEGVPVPFDALEFDERMATTDVLYDLAFLLMDLDHRGLSSQANATFNHYMLHSPVNNLSGLRLLPLFMYCRAGIRAMTTAQELQDQHGVQKGPVDEARQYMELALHYLKPGKTVLVALGGVSGTGKSTQATLLAPCIGHSPGALLLRSDVERKHSLGLEPTSGLPADHYTKESSLQNYELLLSKSAAALDAGVPVIVDAVFLDEHQRVAFQELAGKKGVQFEGLWLYAPAETLEARIQDRLGDASDATVPVLRQQLQNDPGAIAWKHVSSIGTRDQVHRLVVDHLKTRLTGLITSDSATTMPTVERQSTGRQVPVNRG